MPATGRTGRIQGLNKAITGLQRLGVGVADLKDVMSEIATEGARLVSGYVPVRTGNLKRSIRPNKAKAKAIVIVGKARVPYAGAINYGWPARNIAPANFFKRTDDTLGTRALRMLDDGLDKARRKAGL